MGKSRPRSDTELAQALVHTQRRLREAHLIQHNQGERIRVIREDRTRMREEREKLTIALDLLDNETSDSVRRELPDAVLYFLDVCSVSLRGFRPNDETAKAKRAERLERRRAARLAQTPAPEAVV